ncbi:hypothetical protein [Jannaschia marina]|uniref:hypothetical protein n=1 Tax=Jannaschia marina TaxID=2741674 RepID=UPI0015CBB17A|nr:hypothetical protein [Jannaschia marina]
MLRWLRRVRREPIPPVVSGDRFVIYTDPPEAVDRTDLGLTFRPDGGVVLDGCYFGPLAERMFGDRDHEFWLSVAPAETPRFLALLIREAFEAEGRLTVARVNDICAAEGLPVSRHSYS